jgi:uncharacterized protein YigA (DUF484 family)
MSAPRRKIDLPSASSVAAFLRAHPSWLAENPDLYRTLAPPVRVHGEALADHMEAMLGVARAQASTLLAVGRAAQILAGRVEQAVVALVRAEDPIGALGLELPALLGVDAVNLCVEAEIAGARAIPPGTIARVLGREEMRLSGAPGGAPGAAPGGTLAAGRRASEAEAGLFHGEAAALAEHEALVVVPGTAVPAVLALASRDPLASPASAARGPLMLLARATAAALERA